MIGRNEPYMALFVASCISTVSRPSSSSSLISSGTSTRGSSPEDDEAFPCEPLSDSSSLLLRRSLSSPGGLMSFMLSSASIFVSEMIEFLFFYEPLSEPSYFFFLRFLFAFMNAPSNLSPILAFSSSARLLVVDMNG